MEAGTSESKSAPKIRAVPSILLGIILLILVITPLIFLFIVGNFLIPHLPHVAVMTGTAVVHNVTDGYVIEDLDFGFVFHNEAKEGITFKNLTLMTYHGNINDGSEERISAGVALLPFEQRGKGRDTVWVEAKDLMVPVDEWEDYSDTVGDSDVIFKLKGRVRYKGKPWGKQESSMEVERDPVKMRGGASVRRRDMVASHCLVQGI